MHKRHLFCSLLVALILITSPKHAFSWGKGPRLIRLCDGCGRHFPLGPGIVQQDGASVECDPDLVKAETRG